MQDFKKFYELNELREIVGNAACIRSMMLFAEDTNTGKKRIPLLISGPPGTGKTAAVQLLAKKYNWSVIELNASDNRSMDEINKLVVAAGTRNIFGKKNLLFFDEVDELMPKFDKGAEPALSKLILSSKMPIIFTANNRWSKSISFLRAKAENVEFKALSENEIKAVLNELVERLSLDKEFGAQNQAIASIAKICKGDARSAINDFFAMLGSSADDIYEIGIRDRKSNIFESLDRIFSARTVTAPIVAAANVDVDNRMLLNWIDQNIPNRYTNIGDKYRAFSMLAKASTFYTRAARSQYYTYWRYMNVMMSSGVALAKAGYPSLAKRYEFPKVILELAGSKDERSMKSAIAEKLKRVIHTSKKRIINEEMKLVASIMRSGKDDGTAGTMENALKLDQKEIKWLKEYT
ncbi:MAG: replication factor C large subunit [Candidatus Marsarchaeota archaeon]|nr:replication factor C large subunit [Candidatus Marsarchaeota archaeon]